MGELRTFIGAVSEVCLEGLYGTELHFRELLGSKELDWDLIVRCEGAVPRGYPTRPPRF